MPRNSKRRGVSDRKVDRTKLYDVDEALRLLKELATVKFTESVDAVSYTHLTLPTNREV